MSEIVMRVNVFVDENDAVNVRSRIVLSHKDKIILQSESGRDMVQGRWEQKEINAIKSQMLRELEYFQGVALDMIDAAYTEAE